MPTEQLARKFPGACTYWDYVPSKPAWGIRLHRLIGQWQREPAPAWRTLKQPAAKACWIMYFLYLPGGRLEPQHRFTLERLASEDIHLMLICACPAGSAQAVLDELQPYCQALYWKDLRGWDFCAYAKGLSELAQHVPGSDVLVMNDSVCGPFVPLRPFIEQAPWHLTGFTGNNQIENHIQSYAFVIKHIDTDFMRHMADIFNEQYFYRQQRTVVLCQETRMACLAAEKYTVGSYWFTTSTEPSDLCLGWPEQLLASGFPYMKRSLIGKFMGAFNQAGDMYALLQRLSHPVDGHPPAPPST